MRSSESSPSERRAVWARCSKRFIATWRKTVAIDPSMLSASSPSLDAGVGASSSRRPNTSVSPNTLAVSARVSGVEKWNTPWGRASAAWTPWPSSCASVSTSRRRDV
jgi:hypothetical protein